MSLFEDSYVEPGRIIPEGQAMLAVPAKQYWEERKSYIEVIDKYSKLMDKYSDLVDKYIEIKMEARK